MNGYARNEIALTKNQMLVLNTLLDSEGAMSAYNILDRLRDEGLKAPLQVYRALEKLVELGIVHRLECLNAFVACKQHGKISHESVAFAICQSCGKVTEFADQEAIVCLKKWAQDENFQLAKSMIELSGKCGNCALQ